MSKHCKDCESYDKKTKVCSEKKEYTPRKGTCDKHK